MSDLDATTAVEVRLLNRPATIEDVQAALDVLRAEGIPDSFEVEIHQSADRVYERDVPHEDRKVEHILRVSAQRAAKATS